MRGFCVSVHACVYVYVHGCVHVCVYVCVGFPAFTHTHAHTEILWLCAFGMLCIVFWLCLYDNIQQKKNPGYGSDDFKPVKKYQGYLAHRETKRKCKN